MLIVLPYPLLNNNQMTSSSLSCVIRLSWLFALGESFDKAKPG